MGGAQHTKQLQRTGRSTSVTSVIIEYIQFILFICLFYFIFAFVLLYISQKELGIITDKNQKLHNPGYQISVLFLSWRIYAKFQFRLSF